MKIAIAILLLLPPMLGFSQFYFRGEVRDENGKPVTNAKIAVRSTGYVFYSGSSGGFGITSAVAADSLEISTDGYYTVSAPINATTFCSITIRKIASGARVQKNGLSSITKGFMLNEQTGWTVGAETYSSLVENEFIQAERFRETRFAVNIHKASYSNIRRFLNMESPVPPDAVRLEEVLNYFNFNYQPPGADSLWTMNSLLSDCPWNKNNKLLFLQLYAKKIDMSNVPPGNLVFLIDVSGSMDMPNRLPLLKSAFQLMVENLRPIDTVSIIVYGSAAGVWLPPTSGAEKSKIKKSIEDLTPGGATAGASGIVSAYKLAQSHYITNGNNRVILATDGDFNVGQTSERELEELIVRHKMEGIYLTCLGVGMGNYKDSKLEVLAAKGNGNFAYLDHEKEAEKVLVTELTQTLYSVASDVSLNLRLDPAYVKEYRLIGFNNKLNAVKDSASQMEGGEVGSGHALLAMLELNGDRLGKAEAMGHFPLANAEVYYKLPGDTVQQQMIFRVNPTYQTLPETAPSYRMAAALVMFGSLLRASPYTKNISWPEVVELASGAIDKTDPLHTEFLSMVEKAKKIYAVKKKRKRGKN